MPLAAGTRLGPYRIEAPLGSGGMGDVYRARDTTLNRDVAIKVLPDVASDPEQRGRFDREAQLLAALNDPHIAQIYGFEDLPHAPAEPIRRAIVMELVDGPTLADRIARGAVPLADALPIARQIAQALESAHARGIIHRDLKPANIKLAAGGVVKLLDFGLAKALDPIRGVRVGAAGNAAMSSPTSMSGPTHSGMILGTAAYMAPEQARGEPLDERADIWAFGVVLYEMLCGRRPFEGATLSDTIAAVLRQDIDWTALPPGTPADVRRLLRRCLERDPRERVHDAGDVRLMIADVRGDDGADTHRPPRLRPPWIVLGAGAVMIAIWGAWQAGRTTPSRLAAPASPVVRFAIEPPREVSNISNVTIGADGRFLVYEGQIEGESRLFLRRLDGLESRQLAGTEGARWPFTSPDGEWVGFFRDGKIYKVSTDGGDALALCDVRGGPGATWGADGRIIYSRTWLAGLSSVPADGGSPSVLTTPDAGRHEIGHWWPSLLPGGQVLFTIVTAGTGLNDARIGLLDPATGVYQTLFPGARASWLPSGHILFYRTGRYQAVRFDLASSRAVGEAFPVLEDAQELDPSGDWPQPVAVSPSGTLAYLGGPYVPPSRLTWIDTSGALTPLSFATRPFVTVKLSPDGRRAATASLESGRLLIRLFDLLRNTEDAPVIAGMNFNPVWLPDGRLSFTSMRKGDFDVYVKDGGGIGAEHVVLAGPDDTDPVAWTRDGRLVFQGSEPDGRYPLKLFEPGAGNKTTNLTEQHVENGGSLSPDERWLAYQSASNGRTMLYVRPLAGDAPGVPLSSSTGEFPIFRRDNRTLAFLRGGQLLVIPWRDVAGRFEPGPEHTVAPLTFGSGWTYGAPYDVAADGRFLALVRTDPPPPLRIRVVTGWDRDVTRLGQRDPR